MRKKSFLALFLALWSSIHFFYTPTYALLSLPDVQQAKSAAVIDLDSGRLLIEKDAHEKLPMASTTKIMTALLTLEQPNLDLPFTVDADAIRVEGSSMGLRTGDTVTLRTLAYGMLLPSGNDAANAAAVRIAGTQEAFVELMNQRAAALGLLETHFQTPSGLDADTHYSSAYDMAQLTREALSNPAFAEICSQSVAKVSFGAPPYTRWLTNHNKLLKYRKDVIGVKTGFTKQAGRCLVSAARQEDLGFIAVTLGCPDDWNVHSQLYDACFSKARRVPLGLPSVKVPVAGYGTIQLQWEKQDITLLDGESPQIVLTAAPLIFAPVKQSQVLGGAQVFVEGTLIAEIPLLAKEALEPPQEKKHWWSRLFHQQE